MKAIRTMFISFLTIIMTIFSTMSTSAFAETIDKKENVITETGTVSTEYEVNILPGECYSMEDVVSTFSQSSPVDNTFTIGSYHRGGDRSYSTSRLRFMVTITDSNGNATSDSVRIVLRDYNNNSSSWKVDANGSTFIQNNISIVTNRMYYFEYFNSGSKTLRIHMVITPY